MPCAILMGREIGGVSLLGSLALVADGLHMSTHAPALFIVALAYTYAGRHAVDPSFAFGAGKLGDLAGFTSAIILAIIALLIGYEAMTRLFRPVVIDINVTIPIGFLGLSVNIASVWLLSSSGHTHSHGDGHGHGQEDHHEEEVRRSDTGPVPGGQALTFATIRPDRKRQNFSFVNKGSYLESVEETPEPQAFTVKLGLAHSDHAHQHDVVFEEHEHGGHGLADRDDNMHAAFVRVIGDAAVSGVGDPGSGRGQVPGPALFGPGHRHRRRAGYRQLVPWAWCAMPVPLYLTRWRIAAWRPRSRRTVTS